MLFGRFSLWLCLVMVFCSFFSVCLLVLLVGNVSGVLVLLVSGVFSVCYIVLVSLCGVFGNCLNSVVSVVVLVGGVCVSVVVSLLFRIQLCGWLLLCVCILCQCSRCSRWCCVGVLRNCVECIVRCGQWFLLLVMLVSRCLLLLCSYCWWFSVCNLVLMVLCSVNRCLMLLVVYCSCDFESGWCIQFEWVLFLVSVMLVIFVISFWQFMLLLMLVSEVLICVLNSGCGNILQVYLKVMRFLLVLCIILVIDLLVSYGVSVLVMLGISGLISRMFCLIVICIRVNCGQKVCLWMNLVFRLMWVGCCWKYVFSLVGVVIQVVMGQGLLFGFVQVGENSLMLVCVCVEGDFVCVFCCCLCFVLFWLWFWLVVYCCFW